MGRSTQTNIGSKTKIPQGATPNPIEWGYFHPLDPVWLPHYTISAMKGGLCPPSNPWLTMWASHGKNITQPNKIDLGSIFYLKYSNVI